MVTHSMVPDHPAHKTWEDWAGMGLGVLIILSPVFAGETGDSTVLLVSSVIGILVAMLAALELVQLGRWEEVLESLAGLCLIAAPFVLGYADAGVLRWWHFVLGAAVTLVGFAEFWQDRKLSPDNFSKAR
jgi:uncharacterized membrane protein YfcA